MNPGSFSWQYCVKFWLVVSLFFIGVFAQAQTYSPILIFNSSNVRTSTAQYSDHAPGSSAGLGLVVYLPAFAGLNYRGTAALQTRKFNLTYTDDLQRRVNVSTLDVGGGLSAEIFDMIGFFAGVEATWLAKVACHGTAPCNETGGDILAGQLQMGLSMGPRWMKFEPYYEHMPFSPVKGTKDMTTYGLAIHFFPESFSAD